MNPIFRDYSPSDYARCETLVNEAWDFDGNFRPQPLADLTKQMYTKGPELGSNFRWVVEVNGKVAGFIFGLNENGVKPKKSIWFGLSVLWRLMRIKQLPYADKKALLNAMYIHEINRSKLVKRGCSEIELFVVGSKHQGMGYGKQLLTDFINHSNESGVKSIIVETNKSGASGFYELMGFKLIGDFDSPLHAYATPNGQACMYEYRFA